MRRVVLVGHCGFDAAMLRRAVGSMLDGAAKSIDVTAADDERELAKLADGASLLLINRVLEGGFKTDSGVDLIAQLAGQADGDGGEGRDRGERDGSRPRMMLISNYADAQQAAIAAGAHPGFGKADVHSPGAGKLLRAAAGLDD